jgi:GNAT superfamily N-acetyltransferase
MADEIVWTVMTDPRAAPLIEQLNRHYVELYAEEFGEDATGEMTRYPPERFMPPEGAFMLILRGGVAIAGGAFKSYGPDTAEIKRMWTDENHRREGLAQKVLDQLEMQAKRQGYSKIYLTTGFLQTPAMALYQRAGYTPLFDTSVDPRTYGVMPFEKALG